MAGRHYNFRQGDRSELLADYLLSGIGITTPIRRQDDTGFDFYCSISDQENGILTFGFPYVIQIKSKSLENTISYGANIDTEWKSHHVEWLFRNELPLLFGIVDKANQSIEIFDSTSFCFLKVMPKLPAMVQFIPRFDKSNTTDINKPETIEIPNWSQPESNGQIYKVDLGHPLITLSPLDFDNIEKIKTKKNLLRRAISMQLKNLSFFRQRLPYLNWIVRNITDESLHGGWAYYISNNNSNGTQFIINNNAEALISIGIHAISDKKREILDSIKNILKLVDPSKIEPKILQEYPQLFE